jgi:hypothetical protein
VSCAAMLNSVLCARLLLHEVLFYEYKGNINIQCEVKGSRQFAMRYDSLSELNEQGLSHFKSF